MIIKLFFIRNVHTKLYMPKPGGYYGRGGSFDEPTNDGKNARIFTSERAAKIALTAWLKGKFKHTSGTGYDWEGNRDDYEEVDIIPQPHRKREDMEIIEREIVLP